MSLTIKRIATGEDDKQIYACYPSQALSLNERTEIFRGSRAECHDLARMDKKQAAAFIQLKEKAREAAAEKAAKKAAEQGG